MFEEGVRGDEPVLRNELMQVVTIVILRPLA